MDSILVLGFQRNDISDLQSSLRRCLNCLRESNPEIKVEWVQMASEFDGKIRHNVKVIYAAMGVSDLSWSAILAQAALLFPNLRHLHCRNAGLNHLASVPELISLQRTQGVLVSNARSVYTKSLAEWCLFAMMYFNKNQGINIVAKREKKWTQHYTDKLMAGGTLGVLGLGDIGMEIARLAYSAFGMRVTGLRSKKHDSKYEYVHKVVTGADGVKEIFSTCDFVVSVLPSTPHTQNVVDAEILEGANRNLVFINIGRGANVNEDDLADALERGWIKAAALDVFKEEPLPEGHRFWDIPDEKLLISAHCCDWTPDIDDASDKDFRNLFATIMDGTVPEQRLCCLEKGY